MSKRSKRLREFLKQPEEAMDLARFFEAACKRYPRIIAKYIGHSLAQAFVGAAALLILHEGTQAAIMWHSYKRGK